MRKKIYKIILQILSPIAIFLNLNWPDAYLTMGNKYLKKFKVLRLGGKYRKEEFQGLKHRSTQLLKKYISFTPKFEDLFQWLEVNRTLARDIWRQGKFSEYSDFCLRAYKVKRKLEKENQRYVPNIRFIRRKFAYGSLGTYEKFEAYLKADMLGLRPHCEWKMVVEPGTKINNPCYLNYWKQYVDVISDIGVIKQYEPLEKSLTEPFALGMVIPGKVLKNYIASGVIRQKWNEEKRPPLLRLTDQDKTRGWDCLESLGVPKNSWFVCFHVREGGWRDNSSQEEDYRNSDIATYISAMKAIVDQGGWVIRMGDAGMKPLEKMQNVIDYPHTDAKSDWMDIFLSSQCKFFVGTSSGLYTVAKAFGVPVVMTNLLPINAMYAFAQEDLFLPRVCRDKGKNRFLSFEDLLKPPICVASSQSFFDEMNLEIVANDQDDITSIVEEMMKKVDGNVVYRDEEEQLQESFRKMSLRCGKLYTDEEIVVRSRIGNDFLKKYKDLLCDKDVSSQEMEMKKV